MKQFHILTKTLLVLALLGACATLHAKENSSGKEKKEKKATAEKPETTSAAQRKASYFFLEAVKQRLAGNYAEAADLLAASNAIEGKNSAVFAEFSTLFRQRNDIERAYLWAGVAMAADIENYWLLMNFAELCVEKKNYGSAVATLELAIKYHPDEDDPYLTLISLSLQQGDNEKAIETMDKFEKRHGITEDISLEKMRCYINMNDAEKAKKEIVPLINKFPNEPRYLITLGNIYLANDEFDDALKIYQNTVQKFPDYAYAHAALAKYYEIKKDNEQSVNEMDIVLRSRNADFETKIDILGKYLGSVSVQDWRTRVHSLFLTLEEIHPDVPEVHVYFANYLASIGEGQKAGAQMQTAVDLQPDDKNLRAQLIGMLTNTGDTELAMKKISEAKKDFPDEAEWYIYESYILIGQGKQTETIIAATDGLALATRQKDFASASELHGILGDIFYEQEKFQEAFDMYEKGLTFSTTNTHILNNYSYSLAVRNQDLAKAEQMVKLCLKIEPENTFATDTYAWVLFRQGYYHLAQQVLAKLLQQHLDLDNSKLAVIWEHYGDILSKTDRKDEAVEAWQTAKRFGSTSPLLDKKITLNEYVEE